MNAKSIKFILDKMDDRMEQHSNNTACLCYAMGKAINCNMQEVEELWFAGTLLECGKLVINKKIRRKVDVNVPEDECEKKYILYSSALVNNIPGLKNVAKILYQAEENVDGTGEPNHIVGSEIDTLAKVVRIAAYYDNLRLDGISHEDACKKLREQSDKIFPKKIITPFIKCVIKNDLHKDYE